MTSTKGRKDYQSKVAVGFTAPARKTGYPTRDNVPTIMKPPKRRELRPIDAMLESHKTLENKRNAVMKNYFESKQLLSFTKHLDVMKTVYFEKMKRDKLRLGRSLWELEQRKRKIMRQIYEHPCSDVNNHNNPALFYFTQEKTRKKSKRHGSKHVKTE